MKSDYLYACIRYVTLDHKTSHKGIFYWDVYINDK